MKDKVEKGVKGFGAHFSKAAAFHKAAGEAHGQAADAHATMGEACSAMHEDGEAKAAKLTGEAQDVAKAGATMHKAMGAFHKSMSKMHKAMADAHDAHSDHCEACSKAAPEGFTTTVSGSEHEGEKAAPGDDKTQEEKDADKAAADKAAADKAAADKAGKTDSNLDLIKRLDAFNERFNTLETALIKKENEIEPPPVGLSLVTRAEEIRKGAPQASDSTGGLRKAV